MAVIPSFGKISQNIKNGLQGGNGKKAHVRFWLEGDGNCRVTVQGGKRAKLYRQEPPDHRTDISGYFHQ